MIPSRIRLTCSFLVLAASVLAAGPAIAQGAGESKAKATKQTTSRPAAKDDGASATRAGEAALRQRVEQLEEQLADMQVMIGTLESLGRGAAPAPQASASETFRSTGGGGGGVDQARLDSLETQMRAISDQIEQLGAQVRQLNGRRSDLGPPVGAPPVAEAPPAPRTAMAPPVSGAVPSSGFGSITVTPGREADRDRDPIGNLITATPPASPVSAQPLPPAVANAGNPKELYETAYGYLLQQDYAAAEVAFEEFLRRHPADRLAADAQYWLGEALYVQRRYKPAGQAFLKVIEKHQTSNKVPNSILKLAMTLDQLGQKDCSLFDELESKHPNAPADVKSKARSLKQRVGC